MSRLFYLFTFAINLWNRKFVTADFTAVVVDNQHGIQRQGQDFDKNTWIHSAIVTRVKDLKSVHLKCNLFAFFSYLLTICRKFEFLISQGSVATCLRWKWVKIWQSYRDSKGGNFLRHSVVPADNSYHHQLPSIQQHCRSLYRRHILFTYPPVSRDANESAV